MTRKPDTRSHEKDPLAVHIGSAARKARLLLGLTQEDLAERVGVATEVYGKYERGDLRPSTPTLVKLSKVLGTSVDILIGLTAGEVATASETTEAVRVPTLSPDFRRLRRTLRTMDRVQLSTFSRMAAALVIHKRKRRGSQRKAPEAKT